MARFLFLTWDGGGTTVPVVALGRALRERGHDVTAMGHTVQAPRFADDGLPFIAYPRASGFTVTASPANLLALMRNRDAASDVRERLRTTPVDLVVGDPLLVSTLCAVQDAGARYVLLESTFDSLLRVRLRGSAPLLRLAALPVRRALDGAAATIVASVAELDSRAGADAIHIGPVTTATAAHADEPTLLLSLSTFGFPALIGTWQRVLDAVAPLPVRAIATTGPALDPAELAVPANVEVRRWADHAAVMPNVSAAVTHGGHGTTIAALAHGLPVLVLPLDDQSDQPGIGHIVERAGVGLSRSRRSSPARIRESIERLLHDGALRQRAVALGARIRATGGAAAGADALIDAAARP
ncbi:UDP:flavonoid glycosyltransferase YjiC (YdhE family) [Pseudoclavibacter chungangensis]|nr:glycosyltransferase [Pseudoclavibacter chungangensis]NYJ65983.1 UDP:flavonoid glycosyltransferase YjiC (YdhE family) [Pseudoclavibacter chungangensis]